MVVNDISNTRLQDEFCFNALLPANCGISLTYPLTSKSVEHISHKQAPELMAHTKRCVIFVCIVAGTH